jgi:hypothetical protein
VNELRPCAATKGNAASAARPGFSDRTRNASLARGRLSVRCPGYKLRARTQEHECSEDDQMQEPVKDVRPPRAERENACGRLPGAAATNFMTAMARFATSVCVDNVPTCAHWLILLVSFGAGSRFAMRPRACSSRPCLGKLLHSCGRSDFGEIARACVSRIRATSPKAR